MTLSQLEALVALSETGSFTTASTFLGIGQSAVSHALRSLETSLGIKLVDRNASPIILTDAGVRILPYARDMIFQAEAMKQEANAAKGLATGVLRIGSFGSTSSLRLLPKLVSEFSTRYPGIEVYIDEASDNVVAQWLLDRRIELGFVTLPDDRFDTIPLVEDEFVAVLAEHHPLAEYHAVETARFDGLPFIMTDAGGRSHVETILAQADAKPRILFRLPQILSIIGVVQSGLAVSIIARLALPDQFPGVVYRSLTPRAPRQVALAMKDFAKLSLAARAFVSTAQKAGAL